MLETDTNLLKDKHPAFWAKFASVITSVEDHRGDICAVVAANSIRDVISFLKNESAARFNVMMDLFAMDYLKFGPETPERFAIIYNLYSLTTHDRLFIKVFVNEDKPEIDSIHDLYQAANWFEREAWDLFGIVFKNHPHLIRILCHAEFQGHPLRKDYPSDGYQRLKEAVHADQL